jgi:flagellar basal body P-ring formation protein FlgA
MKCPTRLKILLVNSILVTAVGLGGGAVYADQVVLRFHDAPQVDSSIVRLGDLVEIVSGSVPSLDRLREAPLGPAPRPDVVQTWFQSDVLQHLELRGVDPKSIRWTGSDSVQLQRKVQEESTPIGLLAPAFTDQRVLDTAATNVSVAIKEYLNLQSRSRTDWRIEVEIPLEHAKCLQSRSSIESIGGGEQPWTGEQTFLIRAKQKGKLVDITIAAEVSPPPMVVVATGPLRRDQVLTEEMLGYSPLPRNADEASYYTDISQLVGKQLRRSVSTNQALSADLLGEPLVIHRNDLVEVESIAGAVVVRTTAKSLGTGAVGDLVDIEMPNRRRILATVIGPSKVRIAAVPFSSSNR